MKHLKIAGWVWVVFGGSFLALLFLSSPVQVSYAVPPEMRREQAISDAVEVGFFIASVVCGVTILCGLRWARVAMGILSGFLFVFSLSILFFAADTVPKRLFWSVPLSGLALYSLVAVLRSRYVRTSA